MSGAGAVGGAPFLPSGVRMHRDRVRGAWVLLAPERVVFLDPIARDVLALCDGRRDVAAICAELSERFAERPETVRRDVDELLADLERMGFLMRADRPGALSGAPGADTGSASHVEGEPSDAPRATAPPLSMLAELSHRCPLRCGYCSNPVELDGRAEELGTAEWCRVVGEAAALGVLQLHLSGGEPTVRSDLEEIVATARRAELYSNLITSGVLLTRARLEALARAGLDHVQLSIQDSDAPAADRTAGYAGHARKLEVAGWVRELDLPLTINAVVHRRNLERLSDMIELAHQLGARRLEVAHVQYYGWARRNEPALLPSAAQLDEATARVEAARARLAGRMRIDYVIPDFHAQYPKACMDGWGRRFLGVTPSGRVLPCQAAESIPGMAFDSVRERSLASIWERGAAFERFRGTAWMSEPCRSCERREIDFGGCRCQALALTGDAAATDPVCHKSPHHPLVEARARAAAEADGTYHYRGEA